MTPGKPPPAIVKPKDPTRGSQPPPKIPENVRRRPLKTPKVKPIHAEAKRLARERKEMYD